MSTKERIDLSDQIAEICTRLGVPAAYVREIVLRPRGAEVTMFVGREGRGAGDKYIDPATGKAVMETMDIDTFNFDIKA